MLKPLLLGTAMLFAIPALAQTTGSSNPDLNKPGSSSSTMNDDRGGTMSATSTGQTTAGTSTSSAGSRSGSTASGDSDWGTSASSSSSGTGSTSASTAGSGSWNSGSSAYTGRGGPMEGGKSYPTCSRTITDNCMQRGGRGHARHHR